MSKLSTERAIEALDTVRAYYASLTGGYPKGNDCKAIDDITCSEIANSCLMAIKALKEQENPNSIRINFVGKEEEEELKEYLKNQQPCEDCVSRQAINELQKYRYNCGDTTITCVSLASINELPSVTHKTGHWIKIKPYPLQMHDYECSECGHETDDSTENYCSECGTKMEVSKYEC